MRTKTESKVTVFKTRRPHVRKNGWGWIMALAFAPALLLLISPELQSLTSPGRLSTAHSRLEGDQNCSRCHSDSDESDPEKCLECHVEIRERVLAKRGFHADKEEGCGVCHPEHQGEDGRLIDWEPEEFEHEESGCNLTGAHREIRDCARCHRPPNQFPRETTRSFLLKSSECNACHDTPHIGNFSRCADCHGQTSWEVNRW